MNVHFIYLWQYFVEPIISVYKYAKFEEKRNWIVKFIKSSIILWLKYSEFFLSF